MTKMSGLPTSFTIDDSGGSPVTFSNEAATLGLDISQLLQDSSGLDTEGTERIGLRGDWTCPVSGTAMSPDDVIPVFGDVRGSRTLAIAYPGGIAFGGECLVGKFSTAINQDGSWSWSAELSGSDGIFPVLA